MKTIYEKRMFVFVSILFFSLLGMLMVYESSSLYAFKIASDPAYFLKKQVIFFLIGIVFFIAALLVDCDFLKRHNKKFLLGVIFLLVVLFFVGKRAGGAKRWMSVGGFNIQISEMLKVFFLIYCADYVQRKRWRIKYFKEGLFPLGVILGLISFFLVLQPDLGTAIFWIMWMFLFLFINGARRKHLFMVLGIAVIFSFFLIKLCPYRFSRILAYLNPFADPQGNGFQLIQSQIAYGEGGIGGVGLGEGKQKLFFLPAAHTDFIFSIIAEEFGLWGTMSILCIFFAVFHVMFSITKSTLDPFRKNILWGIIFIFFLEVVINVGVSCGLFPTKGLPLPFISYGGSNLVTHFILLGLFFNVSREEKKTDESLISV